jgi:hypothetical protein
MAVPKPPQLRYPIRKIDSLDDYLEIKVIQYVPPKFDTNVNNLTVSTSSETLKTSGNLEKPLITIQLPIPQGINDTSSVGWGEDSLNTAAALGANLTQDVLTSGDFMKPSGKALQDAITALTSGANSGAAQQVLLSKFSSSLVNSVGGNTATTPEGLLTRATGKVLNPHMELLFNNVTLRSFSFQFDLAPRDSKEALVVKQIIRTFKKHMAAKSGKGGVGEGAGGVFISSPEVFQLTYKTGARKHRFLNSFKPMALQNMSVNYTGSGTYATYEDSTPVHMQMTLSFQELNPIYFEDYDDEKDIGVGY